MKLRLSSDQYNSLPSVFMIPFAIPSFDFLKDYLPRIFEQFYTDAFTWIAAGLLSFIGSGCAALMLLYLLRKMKLIIVDD